jgi:tripartite ATP-independent transporter DctP family solute receptor
MVVALAASYGTLASAQTTPERNMRVSIGIPEDHPSAQGAQKLIDSMARQSGGKFKGKLYPNSALGSETATIASVRGGTLEVTIVATAPVATIIKEFLLFDLPFLFQTEKEADTVLDGKFGQKLLDLATPRNMIGLCFWENGFRQLTNSKRSVAKMEDMAGLKIRVMQNPVYLDAFKTMGANAIPMPMPELYTALEAKAVDAQENPITNIYSNKMYEVQKYISLTNHAYSPHIILVSKAFWDKLEPKEHDMMRTACYEARDFERKMNRDLAAGQLEDMKKTKGMTVTVVTPDEMARMRERIKPVTERFIPEIGAEVVAEANREIAKIRGSSK